MSHYPDVLAGSIPARGIERCKRKESPMTYEHEDPDRDRPVLGALLVIALAGLFWGGVGFAFLLLWGW
jgi:hypothetical protein